MELETPASDTAFVASRIPLSLAQTSAPLPLVGGSSRPPARLDPLPAPSAAPPAPAGSRERSRPGTSDVAALRQRVEARLLAREQTIASLTAWLLALYRVQQKVGSTYGTNSSSSSGLRSWGTVSSTTREEHLIKVALMLAGLRMQTCELVEAIFEWRDASALRKPRLRAAMPARTRTTRHTLPSPLRDWRCTSPLHVTHSG